MIDPNSYYKYNMSKITNPIFIERARHIHGLKYDYSITSVNGMNKKVSIVCPTHGLFQQRAASHLAGSGCSLCNEHQLLTNQEFLSKANTKHNNKYSYISLYAGRQQTIDIVCPTHGSFTQKANDHLQGYGCPSCGGTKRISQEDFVARAQDIHNAYYSYTNTKLRTMNNKVLITCSIHGDFKQRPADHINGAGCPECSLSRRGQYSNTYFDNFPDQKKLPAVLYLACVADEFCKIGITKRTTKRRLGPKIEVVCSHVTTLFDAFLQEQRLLTNNREYRFRAQSLRNRHYAGWTECFPIWLLPKLQHEIENL